MGHKPRRFPKAPSPVAVCRELDTCRKLLATGWGSDMDRLFLAGAVQALEWAGGVNATSPIVALNEAAGKAGS